MRLPFVLTALLITLGPASAQPLAGPPAGKTASVPENCRDLLKGVTPAGTPAAQGAQRLGDLPPASLVLAVWREEAGCPVPVIVRFGIGSVGEPPIEGPSGNLPGR